jgi:regulator of replication initiation timing
MTPEVQTLLAIGGPIATALLTAIITLWRRVQEIDTRADALLVENGKLQAEVSTLKAELDRARQRNTELQNKVDVLESDLDKAKEQLAELKRKNQRLVDENRIFRNAFERQGVKVAEPARRASDE